MVDAAINGGNIWDEYSDTTLQAIKTDPRNDHSRTVDAVAQFYLENYDETDIDLILLETPYFRTEENTKRPNESLGSMKGEFDIALVNLKEQILQYYEVKTSQNALGKARDQIERGSETFDNLRENVEDFDWEYIGNTVLSTDLSEEYAVPVLFSGSYWGSEEAIEQAKNNEEFEQLQEFVFDDRLELSDENLLEPKTPGSVQDII